MKARQNESGGGGSGEVKTESEVEIAVSMHMYQIILYTINYFQMVCWRHLDLHWRNVKFLWDAFG